jgi:hypothetical protein
MTNETNFCRAHVISDSYFRRYQLMSYRVRLRARIRTSSCSIVIIIVITVEPETFAVYERKEVKPPFVSWLSPASRIQRHLYACSDGVNALATPPPRRCCSRQPPSSFQRPVAFAGLRRRLRRQLPIRRPFLTLAAIRQKTESGCAGIAGIREPLDNDAGSSTRLQCDGDHAVLPPSGRGKRRVGRVESS